MKKREKIWAGLMILMIAGGMFLTVGQRSVAVAEDVNVIINNQLDDLGATELPGDADNTADIVVDLIRGLLGFLGLIFLVLILYAGFKWMTSGGNSSTIDSAKGMILNAVIGLIIIGFSFAITQFVFNVILKR